MSSIDARLQSRVAFDNLSSVRFSFGSPPSKGREKKNLKRMKFNLVFEDCFLLIIYRVNND